MINEQYFTDDLDRAIEENRIRVCFQPIVRSTNGKICGEEALARWVTPGGEMLYPDDFIPSLEESGLICKLDLYIFDKILETIRMQKELGMPIGIHSFNISEKDFFACDMPEEIRKRTDEAGIPRHLLAVELEENAIGGDYSFMKDQIDRLHALGFKVWLDGFGNAGFSKDLFSLFSPDLIKFDLENIQQYESEEPARIILSELMKMTIGLGIDTVCLGVETKEAEQFLREIGCEKLQGYYYSQPVSYEEIRDMFHEKVGIVIEEPQESSYYDEIGRINLYDVAVLVKNEEGDFNHYFNTIPMAILEINGDEARIVRCNQSYREFANDIVEIDINNTSIFAKTPFMKCVIRCCKNKERSFVTEKLPNKITVRSFIRWLANNPLTGASAVAVAVMSVSDAGQETTYENIARALAADYFKLFYVDMDTENFIEYRSYSGEEELSIERSGTAFFETMDRDARERVLEDDLENVLFTFTKENILHSLETQGTFTMKFRMFVHDTPVMVNMKARRMQAGDSHIIFGMNIIDEQAKMEKGYERKVISNALTGTRAAKLDSLSLTAASFAVKCCIKLIESGDFKDNVRAVLTDILELARADSTRVMLVDNEREKIDIFAEVHRQGCFENRQEQILALRYDLISVWEYLIGENNAIIIENEEDRKALNEKCPEWVQLMKRDGVECLVLVPLQRNDKIYGYLYVLNHDPNKTEKIRETIELVSYFLNSEISNYLFRQELEILSNYDQLTGLKNRHAMLSHVGQLQKRERLCFGILTMDLNGLKKVNDTMGHLAGDELIQRAASMLEDEFGKTELYRIGGDEFIVLFPDYSEKEFNERVEKFIRDRLPNSGVSMSCGTCWSDNNENMEPYFFKADQNMYANKKAFYESCN